MKREYVMSYSSEKLLTISLILVASLGAIEAIGGSWGNSLALIADAGHLLFDTIALSIALWAACQARMASNRSEYWLEDILIGSAEKSAVYHGEIGRSRELTTNLSCWCCQNLRKDGHPGEIVAALLNSLGLSVVIFHLIREAVHHLAAPTETIVMLPVVLTAALGLIVNSFILVLFQVRGDRQLNLESASLHIFADALNCLVILISATATYFWGWAWLDPALSLGISGLLLFNTIPLIIRCAGIIATWFPNL